MLSFDPMLDSWVAQEVQCIGFLNRLGVIGRYRRNDRVAFIG
jgi:hypothetical protein